MSGLPASSPRPDRLILDVQEPRSLESEPAPVIEIVFIFPRFVAEPLKIKTYAVVPVFNIPLTEYQSCDNDPSEKHERHTVL